MLDAIMNFCVSAMDAVLGWLLYLPLSVVVLVVAAATSVILTLVRPFTTNQDLLGRCKQDKKRLKQLIRQARRAKDKEARKRYRTTMGRVSMKMMRAEGKPLLVSVVPIIFLALWCFARLGFVPPGADEPVTLKAYFKVSAIDHLTHLVPQEGLSVEEGWIRRISDDPDTRPGVQRNGLALWTLRPSASRRTYDLAIHYGGETYKRPLEVGGRTYAPALEFYGEGPLVCAEVVMDEFRPFGFVPGIPGIGIPPWLVAYLGLAVPLVFLLKRLCHIY